MIVAIFISLFSIFFALLESKYGFRYGLICSLFLVFLFLGFRGEYGNDYLAYFDSYETLLGENLSNSDLEFKGIEIGWWFLNLMFAFLFGSSGFFLLILVVSAFSIFVLYKFIVTYVPPKYYWFAVFFYVFNFEIMLVQCSAFRQSIAISFFLISYQYLFSRNIFKYSFYVLLSCVFHTSSLFLFLVYFFGVKKINLSYILLPFLAIFLYLLFNFDSILTNISFLSIYTELYQIYEGGEFAERSFGIGFILNVVIYIFSLIVLIKQRNKNLNLMIAVIVLILLNISISVINPMIVRLNFYLFPLMIIVFPFVFDLIKNKNLRLTFGSIVILFTLYGYFVSHLSPIYRDHYLTYNTFLTSKVFWASVLF